MLTRSLIPRSQVNAATRPSTVSRQRLADLLRRLAARLPGLGLWPDPRRQAVGSAVAPRARVGPEDAFCEAVSNGAVRKDLRAPLLSISARAEARRWRAGGAPLKPLRKSRLAGASISQLYGSLDSESAGGAPTVWRPTVRRPSGVCRRRDRPYGVTDNGRSG